MYNPDFFTPGVGVLCFEKFPDGCWHSRAQQQLSQTGSGSSRFWGKAAAKVWVLRAQASREANIEAEIINYACYSLGSLLLIIL